MLSKLILRKCEEHENCQLASENDGDWQHTPSSLPIAERMDAVTPEQQAQIDRLFQQLHAAENMRTKASEDEDDARDLLHSLTVTEATLRTREASLNGALNRAEERAGHLAERIKRLDTLLSRFEDGSDKLDRIDSVYEEVAASKALLEEEARTLNHRIDELNRRVSHEREERLAATLKSVKTDRLLSERIEGLS